MRPLFFDVSEEQQTFAIEDQFLFGPDLLVLSAGVRERKVYLPADTSWRDIWKERTFDGDQSIITAAPLERILLCVRDNAHLPLQLQQ